MIKVSIFMIAFAAGCTSVSREAAAPGINRDEMRALVKSFYFNDFDFPRTYTREGLMGLMRASTNPNLDGAEGEIQSSAVIHALTVVGDKEFARVLSQLPEAVQREVSRDVDDMWTYYSFNYPLTQHLLKRFNDEQVAPVNGRGDRH
jgi:hypothetical protein